MRQAQDRFLTKTGDIFPWIPTKRIGLFNTAAADPA
jgi:hypothetical protein